MYENLDNWEDDKAQEYYLTVCNSKAGNKRSKAIHSLGKLAREGSENAAFALRLIARSSTSSVDRDLASKELSKA
jgi:hypothetical protein